MTSGFARVGQPLENHIENKVIVENARLWRLFRKFVTLRLLTKVDTARLSEPGFMVTFISFQFRQSLKTLTRRRPQRTVSKRFNRSDFAACLYRG